MTPSEPAAKTLILTLDFPIHPEKSSQQTTSKALSEALLRPQQIIWVLTPIVPGASLWQQLKNINISRFQYLWPLTEDIAATNPMILKTSYQKIQLFFLTASFSYRLIFRLLAFKPDTVLVFDLFPSGLLARLFVKLFSKAQIVFADSVTKTPVGLPKPVARFILG